MQLGHVEGDFAAHPARHGRLGHIQHFTYEALGFTLTPKCCTDLGRDSLSGSGCGHGEVLPAERVDVNYPFPHDPLSGTVIRMSTGTQPLRVAIAEEVRAQMARHRVSAVKLGLAIGRSQSYMSRRLTGEVPFDVDDLDGICAALDVPLSVLLGTSSGDGYRTATGQYASESHDSDLPDEAYRLVPELVAA